MQLHKQTEPLAKSDAQLVAEACGRAAQVLGLSKEELSAVVGKHRTTIDRSGLDPQSKAGDHALMSHWLEQPNHHFSKQHPRLVLSRIEGLTRVANYLDSPSCRVS